MRRVFGPVLDCNTLKMGIKAVFFDIDGTLVSLKTHRVPESTKRALAVLRKNGVKVFISSGRPMMSIDNLEGETFDGYITVNGGICYYEGEVIHRFPIPKDNVESWCRYTRANPVDCCMITEKYLYMNNISQAALDFFDLLNFQTPPVMTIESQLDVPVYQIVGMIPAGMDEEARKALPDCNFKRWHPTFADIIAKGSDKSRGMQALLDHVGLSRNECMAFGDGGNDIEMLDFAGIGVVMGGSAPEVVSHADYVTDSVDEDGIWNALEHFGLV